MTNSLFSRLLAALISLSVLFGTAPAYARCLNEFCPQMNTQMSMAHMPMKGMDCQHQTPAKSKSVNCAAMCNGMVSAAFPALRIAVSAPMLQVKQSWGRDSLAYSMTRRPDLPPPILSA